MASQKFTRTSGVYAITCRQNGKVYVGSSIDIRKRWEDHTRKLNKGSHHNSYLQNAWNLHGGDSFSFAVLEECNQPDLLSAEAKWMDRLNATDRACGYNLSKKPGSPMFGLKHSLETLLNYTLVRTGLRHTEATKAKMSASQKGRKFSAEHLANMSASQKGKKASEATRQKLREIHKNPSTEMRFKFGTALRGKKRTKESVEKMVIARSGRFIVTTPDGREIEILGLAPFCRANNLDQGSMTKVAQGKRSNYKGWKCRRAM